MMRRKTLLALAVLAVTLVAAPAAAMASGNAATPALDTQSTDSVAPGERLASVVGMQGAEVDGEMEERTFDVRVRGAGSNTARAAVVADQINDTEARLQELEARRAELEEARENGSITEGEYRARMAQVAAETRTVERMANASENASQGLPADVLEATGVTADALQSLRDRAGNLSGPEVSEIARSIAGADAGASMADERPDAATGSENGGADAANETDRGGDSGNATADDATTAVDRARENVTRAESALDRTREQVDSGSDALDRAEANLSRAQNALDAAQTAAESGDEEAAQSHAADAQTYAEAAVEHAETALDQSGGGSGADAGSDQGGR
jgi:predicted  nucleic acid-binding Zn-ribbon protein